MGLGVSGGVELSMGMFLSVVCAEDVPAITAAERAEARKDPFHGTSLLEVFRKLCEAWPKGLLPEGYHEPVHSDRPVLLLSGLLDPVTPPRWGDEVSQYLTNSLHVVVPGVGHNTLATGCVPDLMQEFVSSGTLESLDVSCVERIRRPRFFDSPLGPGTRRPS
jgi:pimeloyl-ACP methyl ester carboxylesterase